MKKNLLIMSNFPPTMKRNLLQRGHGEGVHGREMRKLFVLGEYEVGSTVRTSLL